MRASLRISGLVALRDLRGRLRDRSALVTAFLAPVALAAILSLAFGAGELPEIRVAVAPVAGTTQDAEAAALLRALASVPAGQSVLRVQSMDGEAQARAALDDEAADAAVLVRPGPPRAELLVLRRADAPVSGEVAEALAHNAALAVAVGARGGEAMPLAEERLKGRSPRSADYYGPAMAVFFVFFVMAFAPLSLIAERRDGTLARLAASPVRMGAVLAGKGLAVFVLALVSVLVVWAVTRTLFGAHWGSPPAVLLLTVGVVLAAGGLTTLAAAGARTERQADGQVSAVVFLGALLGGNFLPLDALPGFLRAASLATPNGWAMRGFTELANGGELAGVLPNVAVLLAMALGAGGVALLRAGRGAGMRP
ncbi:MAG TPA: ABC transporter permease [Egibacteraceae bacterium]|nr:ABC transporter permease [Egibacteraceae bacterium]